MSNLNTKIIVAILVVVGGLLLISPWDSEKDTTRSVLSDYESSPSYDTYGCTQDCSGHDAGWNWAEEHGITEPEDCGGKSQSFIEGCEAYAEEN
ncbi:hypothetical protein KKA27_03475 [Patescibacteria group bacterium]|nr:hypothetical protein [Patescibacteria group bacterium]